MLENFAKLGTTGKKIVAIGDSAGGCLLLSMCIRLIEMDVRRPDSMCLVYPYACSSLAASPSRLLALADPIVPIPLLVRCCTGYAEMGEHEARMILGIGKHPDNRTTANASSTSRIDLQHQHQQLQHQEEMGCPETPTPVDLQNQQKSTRMSSSSIDIHQQHHHKRTISTNSFFQTSKSVGSGLSNLGVTGSTHLPANHHHHHHHRNKSEGDRFSLGLNFHRQQMSEEEREALADLLKLPIFADPVFSPLSAPDAILSQLPKIHIVGSTGDPVLDDSVMLCRRLRHIDEASCDFTVVEGVPHGFLNLALVSRACNEALCKVSEVLQQLTKTTKLEKVNEEEEMTNQLVAPPSKYSLGNLASNMFSYLGPFDFSHSWRHQSTKH